MKRERYLLGLLLIILVGFGACKKEEEPSGPSKAEIEHEEIVKYAEENNLNGQFTESGLYYMILEKGNDQHPVAGSTITVSYKGYYLDGNVFDEGEFFTANINNLIKGWQEGIPLIGEGGRIKLIIPSNLAYNDRVRAFDVKLHYFSK